MFLRAWRHPATRGNRLAAMVRYLGWRLNALVSPGPAVIPFVNDTLLVAEPTTPEVCELRLFTLRDFEAMAFVAHVLRPDDYFVDVGASIGSYAILAAAASGACVTAFEPAPARATLLRRNVMLNELQMLVDTRECALAEVQGQRDFVVDDDFSVTARASGLADEIFPVSVTRLDDARLAGRPVLAKIDVAGDELGVLRGANATLGQSSLCAVIIGADRKRTGGAEKSHLIQTLMEHHGFIAADYDPIRRRVMGIGSVARRKTIYLRAGQAEHVIRRVGRASGLWVTDELCI